MPKVNCWDVKGCGRQKGGAHEHDLGVCPAASEPRLDGVHGGINGGRSCWGLVGTLCGGKVQGHFAMKMSSCLSCDFFKQVEREEGAAYLYPSKILDKLG